ncbi:MAG TPA: flavodoxin-dependent (E)-4-hydroxy-3-methylbut-2-enyl-diphosphate synthase [Bacillota bacterium]|nr:flavodoxin-dependent (E)-4-hydroxy-3-methylbut-2-enyl-diphosphate synthase [Bacillota bacterium]HQE09159.1 flavodoxin-dependent (E)-4-hydroxy-3-methylbut-2-enyl-diphosphate synthase [Bacillota bacterium]
MNSAARRSSLAVKVGDLIIGGGAPVVIQSMTNTRTSDIAATLKQIRLLAATGCELVRVAVPDEAAAAALGELVRESPVPLVADIHFDIRLAYRALEQGAAKIRINPGNMGGKARLRELCRRAIRYGAALRIGVNAGSLERHLLVKHGGITAAALVESALVYLKEAEEAGFSSIVVSLKASDVLTTIEAYRLIAGQVRYPLHLGVTAAGPLEIGTIKGAVGIGTLLAEGIGDTIRVSLTADPLAEVRLARQILEVLRLRQPSGPELISCPSCGRCTVDLVSLVEQVSLLLRDYSHPVKVAVMGCAVNGPGEAREADIGITAGRKRGLIFRRGKIIRTVPQDRLLEALQEELNCNILRKTRDCEDKFGR